MSDDHLYQPAHAALVEQFNALDARQAAIAAELAARQSAIAADLHNNTLATQRLETNTGEIVAIFQSLKGGLAVMAWLGTLGKTLMWIGLPGAVLYTWWSTIKTWLVSGGPKP
jgi:hypothetical protein